MKHVGYGKIGNQVVEIYRMSDGKLEALNPRARKGYTWVSTGATTKPYYGEVYTTSAEAQEATQ